METLSLEEKIASFKKKIDELDPSAAAGGPPVDLSEDLEKEFEKGKIAAMKNKLVRKGLSVDGAIYDGAAAPGDNGDEDKPPPESEDAKAARIAAEFEKGKIAAMKNRLSSKGLELDAASISGLAATAAETPTPAAAEDAKVAVTNDAQAGVADNTRGTAANGAEATTSDDGEAAASDDAEAAVSDDARGAASDDAAATVSHGDEALASDDAKAPASEDAKAASVHDAEAAASHHDEATASYGDEAPAFDSAKAPPSDDARPGAAEDADSVIEGDAEASVADDVKAAGASDEVKTNSEAVTKELDMEPGPPSTDNGVKRSASPLTNGENGHKPDLLAVLDAQQEHQTPADNGKLSLQTPGNSSSQKPAGGSLPCPPPDEKRKRALHMTGESPSPPAPGEDDQKSRPSTETVLPADVIPKSNGQGAKDSRSEDVVNASSRAPATPKATPSELSPAIERPANVTGSKAKAVLAAVKSRARPTSSPTSSRRQQRRRESFPESSGQRPVSAGLSPASRPTPARRPSSPGARTVEGRLQVKEERILRERVSPLAGSVSRATPRRSSTPARQRHAPLLQQHQQQAQQAQQAQLSMMTPSRPVSASPPVVMTPASAEKSGNRLFEQAQEARERLERRRTEGLTSPFVVSDSSPLTPGIVLTPASAEKSGSRLYEQAREARERLERRRKESISPMSPFTPRRWSNPRMGNPSVAGMERLDHLYRDALQRNAKLEIARRTADEKPQDCTFTPEITKRASSRGRGGKRVERGEDSPDAVDGENMAVFHALYLDAKRRQAKIEALAGAQQKQVVGRASPNITARGRQASVEPLEKRMKENAERWTRRWQELEERKLKQEREGCTFMPNFSVGRSASAPRMRPRRDGSRSPGGHAAFVTRSFRFQAERERKLDKLKQEALERERAEATFQPRIKASHNEVVTGARGGTGGGDVFERLRQAANEQEVNKELLKEQFWRQELEKCSHFQVQGTTAPLVERIQLSTQEWVQRRAERDVRRRQAEDEQCAFRPSLGHWSRRSSSAEPRRRRRSGSSRSSSAERSTSKRSAPAPDAFAARSAALQEAREKRLEKLRKEKMQLDLQEATFQPVIGRNAHGGDFAAARAVSGPSGSDLGRLDSAAMFGEMNRAQTKDGGATGSKEPVGFKSHRTRPRDARLHGESKEGTPMAALASDRDSVARGKRVRGAHSPAQEHNLLAKGSKREGFAESSGHLVDGADADMEDHRGVNVDELAARLAELAATAGTDRDGRGSRDAGDAASVKEPPFVVCSVDGERGEFPEGEQSAGQHEFHTTVAKADVSKRTQKPATNDKRSSGEDVPASDKGPRTPVALRKQNPRPQEAEGGSTGDSQKVRSGALEGDGDGGDDQSQKGFEGAPSTRADVTHSRENNVDTKEEDEVDSIGGKGETVDAAGRPEMFESAGERHDEDETLGGGRMKRQAALETVDGSALDGGADGEEELIPIEGSEAFLSDSSDQEELWASHGAGAPDEMSGQEEEDDAKGQKDDGDDNEEGSMQAGREGDTTHQGEALSEEDAGTTSVTGEPIRPLSSGADDSAAEEEFVMEQAEVHGAAELICEEQKDENDNEEDIDIGGDAEEQGDEAVEDEMYEEDVDDGAPGGDGGRRAAAFGFDEDEEDDDDEEIFSYTNGRYAGPDVGASQTSRSLADFDRAQREIEAKLRAL